MPEAASFQCPNCSAHYKLVRIEVPPMRDRELTCLRCGGPLRNRDGKFALKYFLIDGSRRRPNRGRKPISDRQHEADLSWRRLPRRYGASLRVAYYSQQGDWRIGRLNYGDSALIMGIRALPVMLVECTVAVIP